jgi:Holliday junction resolvasome RuvABC endonuclease subunit
VRYVGLDLSLTATGVAVSVDDLPIAMWTLNDCPYDNGIERLDWILAVVIDYCREADMVAVEGLSYGSHTPSALERAGLWHLVAHGLWKRGIKSASIPPTVLKKYVAGKGTAEKSIMIREVYRRWNIMAANDNESDGAGLVMIARGIMGCADIRTADQDKILAKLREGL